MKVPKSLKMTLTCEVCSQTRTVFVRRNRPPPKRCFSCATKASSWRSK